MFLKNIQKTVIRVKNLKNNFNQLISSCSKKKVQVTIEMQLRI